MGPIIYAKVARDAITLRDVRAGREVTVTPAVPFTTVRMLVGNFLPAPWHAMPSPAAKSAADC